MDPLADKIYEAECSKWSFLKNTGEYLVNSDWENFPERVSQSLREQQH